ncbi:MAG: amino acid transport protein [Nitrospirae bacterium]|nr:amino acid transport protein [Nitrospirota bacterium]
MNLLNLDPWYLVLSLIFSTIGFGYFRYGKRQGESLLLIVGVILMVYPYFITNALAVAVVGLLLMAGPFMAKRFG